MVFTYKTMLGLAVVIAFLLLLYGVMRKDHTDTHVKGTKVFRVACILSDSVLYHEKAYEGFVRALKEGSQGKSIDLRTYYVRGVDKLAIEATCKQAVQKPFDAYVIIGHAILTAFHPLTIKCGLVTPVITIGVSDLVGLGLAKSFERPGGNVTGVASGGMDDVDELIPDILLTVRPQTKKVLLPFCTMNDPLNELSRRVERIKKIFKKRGVSVRTLEFDALTDVLERVTSLISEYDVLMFLEGGALVQLAAGFAKLCSKKGVTLLSGTLGGAEAGAALAYAIQPALIGEHAFTYLQKVLFEGVAPGDLPVSFMKNSREFIVNHSVLKNQNCIIPKSAMTLIERGRLI